VDTVKLHVEVQSDGPNSVQYIIENFNCFNKIRFFLLT
jgi:hypothetical protein